MLKKLTIKNFEAHKDTIISFSERFNLIRGVSDSGKSSILRAISVVAFNEWTKKSIRVGTKKVTIKLETDKGSVTCERTSTKNTWIAEELDGTTHDFSSIGRGQVPDKISEILGLKEVKFGDKNIKMNIINQLDKHFLMAEVDGKKITSSGAAQILDEICGLEGIEELTKEIALDISRATRKINVLDEESKIIKDEMEDQKVIDNEKTNLKYIKEQIILYDEQQEMIEDITELQIKNKSVQSELLIYKDKLKIIPDLQKIESNLQKCTELQEKIDDINDNIFLIEEKQENITDYKKELKSFPDLNKIEKMLKNLDIKNKKFFELEENKNSIIHINKLIYEHKEDVIKFKNKIMELEKEKKKVMKRITICPLTGSIINDYCKVERIPVL